MFESAIQDDNEKYAPYSHALVICILPNSSVAKDFLYGDPFCCTCRVLYHRDLLFVPHKYRNLNIELQHMNVSAYTVIHTITYI